MTLQQLPGKPRGRGSESGSTSFSRGLGRFSPAKALRFVRLGAACCQADCKVEGPDESAPPSFRKLKTCLAKGGGFPLLVLLLLRSLQRVGEQGLLRGGFPSLWGPLEHLPKLSHATTKLRLVKKNSSCPLQSFRTRLTLATHLQDVSGHHILRQSRQCVCELLAAQVLQLRLEAPRKLFVEQPEEALLVLLSILALCIRAAAVGVR